MQRLVKILFEYLKRQKIVLLKFLKIFFKNFYKVQLRIFWGLLGKSFSIKANDSFEEIGWSLNHLQTNWGDLLVREVAEKYFDMRLIYTSFSGAVFGGSMLGTDLYESASKIANSKPYLAISCGVKNPIKPTWIPENLKIVGVRGYKTKELLPEAKVVGDPGMLAPILFNLEPSIGRKVRKIFIPHISDNSKPYGTNYEIFKTNLSFGRSSLDLLKVINNSGFILAGSLHAGICAYACGTPFSFYRGNNKENLFKYHDFASAHNFQVHFNEDFETGISWILANDNIQKPTTIEQFMVYDDSLDSYSRYTRNEIYALVRQFNNKRNEIFKRKMGELEKI